MRQARAQRGQILPIVAVALIGLLGICAFSIDVGYAYVAKRQLQAATDAAALAGAQDLPSPTATLVTAADYAKANSPPNLPAYTFTYQLRCTATAILATGCNASVNPNELLVTGTGSTNTWFAGLLGISHFDVTAHANACSPCSATPVDIVVAIDRTGSMCDNTDVNGCIDLNNAKDGVRTMLKNLSPPYAQVGMVAFPPLQTTATGACSAPYNSLSTDPIASGDDTAMNGYDAAGRGYLTDRLNGTFKLADGTLDPANGLSVHTTKGFASSCIQAGFSTSYTEALRQAKAELAAHGRVNVPDYIVFLTDGEANIGSVYSQSDATYPQNGLDDRSPCSSAVLLANTYKAAGTTIYTIGYALGNNNCTGGGFHKKVSGGGYTLCTAGTAGCYHFRDAVTENPINTVTANSTITSNQTLGWIASPNKFWNQATAGPLDAIFAAIATDIGQGTSRLVDDGF
jgi:Flp pilus assembly protein TadG